MGNLSAPTGALPLTVELGGVTNPDDPRNPVTSRPIPSTIWTPPARQALPIVDQTPKGELGRAIDAGRTCSACRYFDREAGQRKFQRERLYQAIVRELAWQPEWFNPADYGLCGIDRRTATHQHATCENFVPVSRMLSFFGMGRTR